jgi:hypothetical protein
MADRIGPCVRVHDSLEEEVASNRDVHVKRRMRHPETMAPSRRSPEVYFWLATKARPNRMSLLFRALGERRRRR